MDGRSNLRFAVVQGESSRDVLEEMVDFFGCGNVYVNRRHDNHREDLYRYNVSRFGDLRDVIVPFFQANPLRTAKRDNFAKFAEIIGSDGVFAGTSRCQVSSRSRRSPRR